MPEKELKKYRWKEIAIVFQNSLEVLNPVLSIKEQIGEPIKTHAQLSPPLKAFFSPTTGIGGWCTRGWR